jgi:hypothetical protein
MLWALAASNCATLQPPSPDASRETGNAPTECQGLFHPAKERLDGSPSITTPSLATEEERREKNMDIAGETL